MMTLAYTFPTWMIGILIALFFVSSVLMILTVLIQRPMGGGLSGAFGSGAGSGQTAFGAKTGDALTIATIIMFVVFLVGAVVLNYALDVEDPVAAPGIGTGSGEPVEATTGETPVPPEGTPTGEAPVTPDGAPVPPVETPSVVPADVAPDGPGSPGGG